jgi:MoaA/NifB/PqqE/SkfB family radical SAM enzyme
MKLIKETQSVCPNCSKTIKAYIIIYEDNSVRMHKKCTEHGFFNSLIDVDYEYYKIVVNKRKDIFRNDFVFIPVTGRCNLDCIFCITAEDRHSEDVSTDVLKNTIGKIISDTGVSFACLTGGEPTMREDLSEIISFLREEYPEVLVVLVTNGIKIADINYLRKLKKAGLDYVSLSINSFDGKVYKEMNGNEKILDVKLQALKNLKQERIKTTISPMMVREINSDAISDIIKFALNNLDFIEEVRIRNASMVGNYRITNKYSESEMVDLMLDSINKNRSFLFKNFRRNEIYCSSLGICVNLFIYNGIIVGRTFGEYYKNNIIANWRTLEIVLPILIGNGKFLKFLFGAFLLLLSNTKTCRDAKDRRYALFNSVGIQQLRVKIWNWMDKANLDLEEVTTGGGLVMSDIDYIDAAEFLASK